MGHAVAQLSEALRYKLDGSRFDCQWCHSSHTMALGSTQHLTEVATRNISWGVKAAGA
jgi:pyruvate-formate lyase-activating enzyme